MARSVYSLFMTTNNESVQEVLESVQAQIGDLRAMAQALADALDCAESCESVADLRANLEDARDAAKRLTTDLKVLISESKGDED